jgi:hypothetical protein
MSLEQINLTNEQAREISNLKNEYVPLLSDIIRDLIKTPLSQPFILSMAVDAIMGMLFNQAQWVNPVVSSSQQSNAFKRFAYGIITTMKN